MMTGDGIMGGFFDPALGDLPEILPVFPLSGALLLPRGHIPLNIFEPRYLEMVSHALAHGRMIGMVQPRPDQIGINTEDFNNPPIFKIGCAGRITAFSETDDGRLHITLTGVCRFNIKGEEPSSPSGFRLVKCDFNPWKQDLRYPYQEESSHIDRIRLRNALDAYLESNAMRSCWDMVADTDDETLVTSLAMGCRLSPLEKQALLECTNLYDRSDMLTTLLEMAAHAQLRSGANN